MIIARGSIWYSLFLAFPRSNSSFGENTPRIGFIGKWNYEEHFLSRSIIDRFFIKSRATRAILVVTRHTLHSLTRPRTFHQFAVTAFRNLVERLYSVKKKNLPLPNCGEEQREGSSSSKLKNGLKNSLYNPGKIHLCPPLLADSLNLPASPGSRRNPRTEPSLTEFPGNVENPQHLSFNQRGGFYCVCVQIGLCPSSSHVGLNHRSFLFFDRLKMRKWLNNKTPIMQMKIIF